MQLLLDGGHSFGCSAHRLKCRRLCNIYNGGLIFVAWQADALPMVLVTVVRADGSTPREVGATMLLRFNLQQQWQQSDTIGGGH